VIDESGFIAQHSSIDNFGAVVIEEIVIVSILVFVCHASIGLVDTDNLSAILHDELASD
jgi:hypothetical protein